MGTLRGLKIKLKPNKEQAAYINQCIIANRFFYNKCLEYSINNRGTEKPKPTRKMICDQYDWLKTLGISAVFAYTFKNYEDAYKRFFIGLNKYPKFKSKDDVVNLKFGENAISKKPINDLGNRLNLTSKLIGLKFLCSKEYKHLITSNPDKIKAVIISRDKVGDYWGSVLMEVELIKTIYKPKNEITGIDIGIKTFLITANENNEINEYDNLKTIRKNEKYLKRYHKNLSRKIFIKKEETYFSKKYNKEINVKIPSKNRIKAKIILAKKMRKLTNLKNDFLHKTTSQLIQDNGVIAIEDLNVKGMTKNKKLAKSIQELSISEFTRQLEYKAKWYNRKIIKIDRYYPSSKTCSCCGGYKKDLSLKDRTYVCEICGVIIDRDANAAINIKNYGLKVLNGEIEEIVKKKTTLKSKKSKNNLVDIK